MAYTLLDQAGRYLERAAMHIEELIAEVEPSFENSFIAMLAIVTLLHSQEEISKMTKMCVIQKIRTAEMT